MRAGAEFHDIGKIIDWRAVGLQKHDELGRPEPEPHDFEKCKDPEWGIDFSVPLWQAIFRKDDQFEQLRKCHWADSLDWAFVSAADELAAGFGRGAPENLFQGEPRYGRYSLWTGKLADDPRLTTKQDLRYLIAVLNTSPTWQEIENRYGTILRSRAETARPGLNVTSVYAHSITCGKISRVLEKLPLPQLSKTSSWADAINSIGRSKLVAIDIRLRFPQRPFRTRDLNIFEERRKAIRQAAEQFQDNVLAVIGDQIVALFGDASGADSLAEYLFNSGFHLEQRRADRSYAEFKAHGIQRVLAEPWKTHYPRLPAEVIQPPLCESCQMDHGQKRWPADILLERNDLTEATKDILQREAWANIMIEDLAVDDRLKLEEWLTERGEERLCERCFTLRRSAPRLTHLARWQEGQVAWVTITLDLNRLIDALCQLHKAYARSAAPNVSYEVIDRIEVRLPLIVDFLEDYKAFLQTFESRITAALGENDLERVDEGLWCIRLENRSEAIHILRIYDNLVRERFPKIIDSSITTCPLLLGISISSVKYPFFVHWRFLERPSHEISVQIVGSGTALMRSCILQTVLGAVEKKDRRALHRLREISDTSYALSQLVLNDKYDRHSKEFEQLRKILPLGLDFESLVTLANLAED